jgi:hypothetical protein
MGTPEEDAPRESQELIASGSNKAEEAVNRLYKTAQVSRRCKAVSPLLSLMVVQEID